MSPPVTATFIAFSALSFIGHTMAQISPDSSLNRWGFSQNDLVMGSKQLEPMNRLELDPFASAVHDLDPTSTITNSASATPTQTGCIQDPTIVPGAMYLLSPNINIIQSNIGVVGGFLNITWMYDTSANTTTPSKISIYTARLPKPSALVSNPAPITPETYYTSPIALAIPGNNTSFLWSLSGVTPGFYKLRIVADGLDPGYYAAINHGLSQCFRKGQPLPAISGDAFVIADAPVLRVFRDEYGPLSGTRKHGSVVICVILIGLFVGL